MIQELNVNNFDQEINKDKPVVVEFYTTACSHCKKLAGALNKLSEEKGDDVFFGKCNIDQEALLQSRFDISAVPTLLFIKNGEIKNRLVGEVHPLIIQEEIKKPVSYTHLTLPTKRIV